MYEHQIYQVLACFDILNHCDLRLLMLQQLESSKALKKAIDCNRIFLHS